MSIDSAPSSVVGYYPLAFRKFATFTGRATRAEYWYFTLFNAIIYFALAILAAVVQETALYVVVGVYILAIFVPVIALTARRFHDAGFTGWLQLLSIIPGGGIATLIFAILPGNPGPNKYGPDPRQSY